jgi:uncharacterized protein YjbI with pentapeptide repeats
MRAHDPFPLNTCLLYKGILGLITFSVALGAPRDPPRPRGVLPFILCIVMATLVLHCLASATASTTARPAKCADHSIPTPSICERIELNMRENPDISPPDYLQCESKYQDGSKPAPAELVKILESHTEWLSVYAGRLNTQEARKDQRRANLCGADLRETNLQGVNLSGAALQEAHLPKKLAGIILEGAELWGANLSRATLEKARLTGAFNMTYTNLCGANLRGAKLNPTGAILVRAFMYDTDLDGGFQDVDLCGAGLHSLSLRGASISISHFEGAHLTNVDLSGATLRAVNLSKAHLTNVNLRGAILIDVDLSQAHLDLKDAEGLQVLGVKGLSSVTFSNPTPMVTLRKNLKESGLRSEEKAVTSTLRKFAL